MLNLYEENRNCKLCPLSEFTNPITLFQNKHYDIMVVDFKPSLDEELTEIPFTGRTGQLARKIFGKYNLSVYYCYSIKCFHEGYSPVFVSKTCRENWLFKEIETIKPNFVFLLGKATTKFFNKIDIDIGKPIMYNNTRYIPCYSLNDCLNSNHYLKKNEEIIKSCLNESKVGSKLEARTLS